MRTRAVCAAFAGLCLGLTASASAEPTPLPQPRHVREVVMVDPVKDVAPDARATELSHILYVNRCAGDCVIMPGDNDALDQTSSIIGDTTRTISEFSLGDDVFNQVIDCLKDVYSPYDVQIVTEDPSPTFHHEAILAGSPEEIGAGPRVGGIAPATCTPLNNVISFSFANFIGADVEELCWTAAQESAHSFGLPNHVYECLDPMTYLEGPCGRKYFRNDYMQCAGLDGSGNFVPQPCVCESGTVQNSHEKLLEAFGPGTTPPPPTVSLIYPADGSSVQNKFAIFFTAVDPRLIDTADVYVNGWRFTTVDGYPYDQAEEMYSVTAPDYPDGYMDLEVHAKTGIGTEGVAKVTVLKGSPCQSDDQCFDHQSCADGRCSYPPAEGEFGDSCEYDQYCLSNICRGVCSQTCAQGVSDACPDGYECSDEGLCVEPSGGCCAVAGGQRFTDRLPLAELSLFALGLLLLRGGRRRRRRG
jgi:hypothetical protein